MTTGLVVKVAMGAGAALPTLVGASTSGGGLTILSGGGVINGPLGKAYFAGECTL